MRYAFLGLALWVASSSEGAEPAWCTAKNGIRVGISAKSTEISFGDPHIVELGFHVQNVSDEEITLPMGGAVNGWQWEFRLVGAKRPFIPRWDDDTGGAPAPSPPLTVKPGETIVQRGYFAQRSFRPCRLVPGEYRVRTSHAGVQSGVVRLRIRGRGDAWDELLRAEPAALVMLLDADERRLREAAAAFLVDHQSQAIVALIAGLRSSGYRGRAHCAALLGELRDKTAVESLAAALGDSESSVRIEAAKSLRTLAKFATPAVPQLIVAARDPSVMPVAVSALAAIGDGRAAVTSLFAKLIEQRSLGDNDYAAVAYATSALRSKAVPLVPALLRQLETQGRNRRCYLLSALQGIGPAAKQAAPAVLEIVADKSLDIDLRTHAAYTLCCMPNGDALPRLQAIRSTIAQPDAASAVFASRLDAAIEAAIKTGQR